MCFCDGVHWGDFESGEMGGFWPDLFSKVNVNFNLNIIFVFRAQNLVGDTGWMPLLK